MIAERGPINVYARAWRVKYVTVTEICLMTTIKALMTVRDLKAAYHLIRYTLPRDYAIPDSLDYEICKNRFCGSAHYTVRVRSCRLCRNSAVN